jgi:hypothetical protein
MRKLIRQLCSEAYKHLVLVWGMEIRWNTTYAEMDHDIKLKPVHLVGFFTIQTDIHILDFLFYMQAVNYWVDQLDSGLRRKKKAAATRKKKLWHISHSEWELLERLCIVLKVHDSSFIHIIMFDTSDRTYMKQP